MATLTKINATITATAVLPANPNRGRGGLLLENTDANRCYVLFGDPTIVGNASSTNYSFSLDQYDPVGGDILSGMKDQMSCVWGTAAGGILMVTEWVD